MLAEPEDDWRADPGTRAKTRHGRACWDYLIACLTNHWRMITVHRLARAGARFPRGGVSDDSPVRLARAGVLFCA